MASSLASEQALLNKAIKQEKSATGGWGFFGGKEDKYEQAVDMYKAAANAYRLKVTELSDPDAIRMAVDQGGSALESAARISTDNLQQPRDAANAYKDAFQLYQKYNPERAAYVLEQASTLKKGAGDFSTAATMLDNLARHYQQEMGDNQKAIEAFKKSLACYEFTNTQATANRTRLALADLLALEGDYRSAIDKYEEAATHAVNNNTLQFNVKDYLFHAGICNLATGDMVATARNFEKYTGETYRVRMGDFASSRECQLLHDLKEAVDQGDQDVYADKLFQFDQMRKLDKWETTILLRIKEKIEEKDEDFS